jgi:Tol biopolymer transport system component
MRNIPVSTGRGPAVVVRTALPPRAFQMCRWAWSTLLLCLVVSAPVRGQVEVLSSPSPGAAMDEAAAGSSEAPAFSADGRQVFFVSNAGDLVGGGTREGSANLFRRDLAAGTNLLVNVSQSGTNSARGAVTAYSVSANGRWVAFTSPAADLVPGDTNRVEDVFLRDLETGTTQCVSRSVDGRPGNEESRNPILTPDGRFVLFESVASNLVSAVDTNRTTDVFLWDRETGTSTLLSALASGAAGDGPSVAALVSGNGERALFRSRAPSMAASETNTDLYVWSRLSGLATRLDLPRPAGRTTLTRTYNHVLSGDGRYVAFRSRGLTSDGSFGGGFWWVDLDQGTMVPVHEARNFDPPLGDSDDSGPVLSADGQRMAFALAPSSGASPRVRLWSPGTGIQTLAEAVTAPGGVVDEPVRSWSPRLSPDGKLLAFLTDAAVPAAGVPQDGPVRLYVRNLATGETRTLFPGADVEFVEAAVFSPDSRTLLFQSASSLPGTTDRNSAFDVFRSPVELDSVELLSRRHPDQAPSRGSGFGSMEPGSLSDDGRFVAFASHSDDLVSGDTNGRRDVFVRDLVTGTVRLVSVGLDGRSAAGDSWWPRISGDGRRVAFVSDATNLVAGAGTRVLAVYVRDLVEGSTQMASARTGTNQKPSRDSVGPRINADGQWVLLESAAPELHPRGTNSGLHLYLRHLPTRRTLLVSSNQSPNLGVRGAVSLSADGRRVAFIAGSLQRGFVYSASDGSLRSWDQGTRTTLRLAAVSLSGDGTRMAVLASVTNDSARRAVYWMEVGSTNRHLIAAATTTNQNAFANLSISANGRVVAFDSNEVLPGIRNSNGTNNVFVYEISRGILRRVSASRHGDRSGNGASDSPWLSADGRIVGFRSHASDLVEGDANGLPDVFVYDLVTRRVELLSRNADGSGAGNGRSFGPWLSGNGRTAVFGSFAGDLVSGDLNQAGDLFARVFPEPVPLALSGGVSSDAGRVRLGLTGPAGVRVVLEGSPDLRAWTPVSTNLLPAEIDLEGGESGGDGFYRTLVVPPAP